MAVRFVIRNGEKVLQFEEEHEEDPLPHCEPLIKMRWVDVPIVKED